jgi:hypothetical protein
LLGVFVHDGADRSLLFPHSNQLGLNDRRTHRHAGDRQADHERQSFGQPFRQPVGIAVGL